MMTPSFESRYRLCGDIKLLLQRGSDLNGNEFLQHALFFPYWPRIRKPIVFFHESGKWNDILSIYSQIGGMCAVCRWKLTYSFGISSSKERKELCGEPYGLWLYRVIIEVMEDVWLQQPTKMWTMSWISTSISWKMRRKSSVTNN